jgi:hypothetical protein
MSYVNLHRGHGPIGCSRQLATVAVATVARLGLRFPDLYIRSGYAIIRRRQDQSWGLVPCPWGVAAAIGVAAPLGLRGHLSRLGLYPCP